MFIKNLWYVAAWDHEVTQEGLFSRTIIGLPVLMYRTQDGQVVAMEIGRASCRERVSSPV